MLDIKNVDAGYGDMQVLYDVSMGIEEKETVALIGSNGAGKSTTLKTISGIISPIRGEIIFDGERIDGKDTYKIVDMGIIHVPERRRIFPQMTVIENLEIGAYTKRAKKQRSRSIDWVFSLFPRLKERIFQLAGTMSGGEQQMLAVGRGLMGIPRLFLLDEPSLGLAPIIVKNIFDVFKEIKKEGVTMLIVEQNVIMAFNISDRVYVMENGRISISGSGRELMENDHIRKVYMGI